MPVHWYGVPWYLRAVWEFRKWVRIIFYKRRWVDVAVRGRDVYNLPITDNIKVRQEIPRWRRWK